MSNPPEPESESLHKALAEMYQQMDVYWHHSVTCGLRSSHFLITDGIKCDWDDIGFWATFDSQGRYVRCGVHNTIETKLRSLTFYDHEIYYDYVHATSRSDSDAWIDMKKYKQVFKRNMKAIIESAKPLCNSNC